MGHCAPPANCRKVAGTGAGSTLRHHMARLLRNKTVAQRHISVFAHLGCSAVNSSQSNGGPLADHLTTGKRRNAWHRTSGYAYSGASAMPFGGDIRWHEHLEARFAARPPFGSCPDPSEGQDKGPRQCPASRDAGFLIADLTHAALQTDRRARRDLARVRHAALSPFFFLLPLLSTRRLGQGCDPVQPDGLRLSRCCPSSPRKRRHFAPCPARQKSRRSRAAAPDPDHPCRPAGPDRPGWSRHGR